MTKEPVFELNPIIIEIVHIPCEDEYKDHAVPDEEQQLQKTGETNAHIPEHKEHESKRDICAPDIFYPYGVHGLSDIVRKEDQ